MATRRAKVAVRGKTRGKTQQFSVKMVSTWKPRKFSPFLGMAEVASEVAIVVEQAEVVAVAGAVMEQAEAFLPTPSWCRCRCRSSALRWAEVAEAIACSRWASTSLLPCGCAAYSL